MYYSIYGLTVDSEIKLDQLSSCQVDEKVPDITISYHQMPDEIKMKKQEAYLSGGISKKYYWFNKPGVADFYIQNGNEIWVEPEENTDTMMMNAMILGVGFGFLMYQREDVYMHGSGLVIKNRGVLISGESGAGKSTLANQLIKDGALFLADDTMRITLEEDKAFINPSFPMQKLCRDAAIAEGYNVDNLLYLDEEKDKFGIARSDIFVDRAIGADYFFEIDISEKDTVEIVEASGKEKLDIIFKNLFMQEEITSSGFSPMFLSKVLKLASAVRVFKILRPQNKKTVQQISYMVNQIVE